MGPSRWLGFGWAVRYREEWRLSAGSGGLQIATVIPDTEEPWKRATVPFLTSVGAWTTLMLAATTAVRHTKVPVPISAIVLGGGVLAIDSLLTDLGEARNTAQAAQKEISEPAQP